MRKKNGQERGENMTAKKANMVYTITEAEKDSAPYARRLYYHPEYDFQTEANPNAKGKWFEDWVTGRKKDFAGKIFAKLYKKEAGL